MKLILRLNLNLSGLVLKLVNSMQAGVDFSLYSVMAIEHI